MKMFVWCDPYRVKWGSSMCVAIAADLESAKQLARQGKLMSFGEFKGRTPEVELGEPTRVLEIPCAEWYEWME